MIAKNLQIVRGDLLLSDPLDFTVESGQILHVQGHNGAGKTTLLMMLAGLLPVVGGSTLLWADAKPSAWPVLYIGHRMGINSTLSVRQNLEFLHALNSETLIQLPSALEAVGLVGYEDTPVAQLSSGQKRRVALARLWLTSLSSELWLLDEPLTALDQVMVERLCQQLQAHTKRGGRVILTSHQSLTIPCQILNLAEYSASAFIEDDSLLSNEDRI
ncbi:cytochrome c biogenesis heme-transporting ATPase CcmA [Aquirhabdus parva]|uniref:Cytochrome c biogenesis heme-transporting ATPase CcmA n=1 Tax=Aquirhabdus parva TaxID=2283318 RepID=A0A345PBG5_9GAMM|nr:cytochrome c biogenesis heme-transporting ATPase CcmA [Aquirhabdus parva]